MKSLLVLFILFSVTGSLASPAKPMNVKQIVIGPTDAYFPSGFDTKADPMVVVTGYFPSSCYSLASVEVNHLQTLLHEVKVVANVQQGFCAMALIPYQKTVSLGALVTGEHKIRFPSSDGTYFEKTLIIE